MEKHDDSNEPVSALIAIPIAKIYAIGEIIKGRDIRSSLNEEEINFGLGEILTDLAHQLEELQTQIINLELKVRICHIEHRYNPTS